VGETVTILIIEDDPEVALLLMDILDERGFSASRALDPERIPADIRPSLILTDLYGAPWYDVEQAAMQVASLRARFPGVAIVVVTAYGEAGRDRVAIGADAIVPKPFDIESLIELVSAHVLPAHRARLGAHTGA